MKKVLYAIGFFVLCSCTPKYSEHVYVSDFTKYVKSGFEIYPVGTEIKERAYYPVADIKMNFYIGKESSDALKSGLKPVKDEQFGYIYTPTGEYITDKVANEAKKHDANAIMNYKVDKIQTSKGALLGYSATGVAVKIK
ncbi:MAG: hypothetical protein RSH25_15695 [Bacteroides sp.]|uniref:hypothetical protein n=1 Tax=Bacteroides sp. TaxID=29523 RepID=UPI002FCA7D37